MNQPTTVRTFDVPMMFPLGAAGSPAARQDLVKKARERLERDIGEKGLEPLPDTFRVSWEDAGNGKATMSGVAR